MNSLTSGDVMTAIAFILGIAFTLWASLVTTALVFGAKAQQARDCFERTPWLAVALGAGVGLPAFVVGFVLLQVPNPAVKLVATGVLFTVLAISMLGAGGLARLVADRIQGLERDGNGYGALARGAGLMVGASMVPLFGWMFIAPLGVLASFGAGIHALTRWNAPDRATTGQPHPGAAL